MYVCMYVLNDTFYMRKNANLQIDILAFLHNTEVRAYVEVLDRQLYNDFFFQEEGG